MAKIIMPAPKSPKYEARCRCPTCSALVAFDKSDVHGARIDMVYVPGVICPSCNADIPEKSLEWRRIVMRAE